MSPLSDSSPGHASSPSAVLDELRQQAERKAVLKMFYSAADAFREYKGPFASETSREREALASEYEQLGRAAEAQRWGDGTGAPPAPRVTPVPRPPPAVRPPSSSPPRPQPKVEASPPRPIRKTEAPRKQDPQVRVEGGQITFPCRWCKEPISIDASNAGKLVPCPKCDLLVSVPKPTA